MTKFEAKVFALQSLQAGRNRAKEVVQRVVSYTLEKAGPQPLRAKTDALAKSVTEALLNPNHEARAYPKINRMFQREVNNEFIQQVIDDGRVVIKL